MPYISVAQRGGQPKAGYIPVAQRSPQGGSSVSTQFITPIKGQTAFSTPEITDQGFTAIAGGTIGNLPQLAFQKAKSAVQKVKDYTSGIGVNKADQLVRDIASIPVGFGKGTLDVVRKIGRDTKATPFLEGAVIAPFEMINLDFAKPEEREKKLAEDPELAKYYARYQKGQQDFNQFKFTDDALLSLGFILSSMTLGGVDDTLKAGKAKFFKEGQELAKIDDVPKVVDYLRDLGFADNVVQVAAKPIAQSPDASRITSYLTRLNNLKEEANFTQIQTNPRLFQQTRSLENLAGDGFEEYKVSEILKNFDEQRLLKSPVEVARLPDESLVVTSGHNRFEVLKRAKESGLLSRSDAAYLNVTDYADINKAIEESIASNIRSKSIKDINVIDLAVRGTIDERQLREALAFDQKKINFVEQIAKTFREQGLVDFWSGSVGARLAQFKNMDFGLLSERLNFVNSVAKNIGRIADELSPQQLQAVKDTIASKISGLLAPSKIGSLSGVEKQITKYLDTIRTEGYSQEKLVDLFGKEGTITTVKKQSGVQALRKAIDDQLANQFVPEDTREKFRQFLFYLDDPQVQSAVNLEVGLTSKAEKTQRFLAEIASGEVDIPAIKTLQEGSSTGSPYISRRAITEPGEPGIGTNLPSLNLETPKSFGPASSMRYTTFSKSTNLNDIALSSPDNYTMLVRNNARKNLRTFADDVKRATGVLPEVRVKEAESLAEKLKYYRDTGEDVKNISDILGARIIVNASDINQQIKNIQSSFRIQEGKIKNYFLSPTKFGYRGVNINVELPNGMLAEIQVHTPVSKEIADKIHPIYKKWERMTEIPKSRLAEYSADVEKSNQIASQIIAETATRDPRAIANGFLSTAGYKPESAASIEASLSPTQAQSRLANLNQSRSVSGQEQLPRLHTKPLSYTDSIIRQLPHSQEAQEASTLAQAADDIVLDAEGFGGQYGGNVRKPKVYGELVAGMEDTGKDISGFTGQARDVYRNFEAFFGKRFEQAKELILDPFDAAKGEFVDTQKKLLAELKSEVVDKLGIKMGSKESAAVMNYGEKLDGWNYADLIKKFGEEKAGNIVRADQWFRAKYDQLLDEVNESRKSIYGDVMAKKKSLDSEISVLEKQLEETAGDIKAKKRTDTLVYNKLQRKAERLEIALAKRNDLLSSESWWRGKVIPKRPDYYRHFRDMTGVEGLQNILETPHGIDPTLAGISPFTKPKSRFLSFAQKRLGFRSDRDAVGGFLDYVPNGSYAMHIDPEISKFRTLAADLAIQTEKSKNVNNFIEFLQDFGNDLAGKTNSWDRNVQKIIPGGRKTFAVMNWLNKRIKANMIIGNLSSSVAQIFNVPQGIASAKHYSIPGATRTMGSIFTENKAMAKSTFIKERYFGRTFQEFDERWLADTKQFASWVTGVLDELGTKFIWNSHYEKALARKIENPIKYADDATRKLVAGRGVGEIPLIQKGKLFQMIAPFQLEVGNLWWVMHDQVKAKDFAGLATLFVANWLFNRVAENIRGNDVTFDPINAVHEGIMELQGEDELGTGVAKLGGRLAGEVLSNIPFGQTLASWYPEYGFESLGNISRRELMGEGDPTRFGSGLLIFKGLRDPLFKVIPGFGGSQLQKAYEGINTARDFGIVRDKKGKKKFRIEQSPINTVREVLFGPSATPEAQEYFDRKNNPQKKSKTVPGLPPLR